MKCWKPERFGIFSEADKGAEMASEQKPPPTTSTAAEKVADTHDQKRFTSTSSPSKVQYDKLLPCKCL